ncbi:MAG: hypothetical protein U9R34_01580 [Nanoarchaeota archaeon]|nr:hypothetical protein [Nanoarchaeota archaeon]
MDATQQISKFQEFFEDNYHAEILELIRKGNNFIIVDFVKLLNYDPDLSTFLLDYPDELIKAAEIAIEKFDLPSTMKNFKVRFIKLPESQNIMISNIRSNHIDKFLVVEGVVRQKSDVRPQVTTARFECPSCGNVISVIQLEKAFKEPNKCGCGRKGKFRLLSKEFVDAQGIVLEEASEDLEGGEQPKRMNVFLSRDLVSPLSEKKTNPGSRIRVAGVLKEVPVELRSGAKATRFDLIIESNSVEAVQEDFYDICISEEEEKRIIELAKDPKCVQKLIQSVAPSIYGYEKIKEALIFQLVGGNRKKRPDGAVTRGDMHVLLIGDPGAAKSQLLKRISLVAPKARYVSGKGVSGAGLTASVVKDEMMGGWALEAGALVLSNKGFCLSGDTKIWDSTGRLLSIKEIYDGFKRKRKISIKHFDEKKLRLKDSKIKQVSRRTAQNLLEITFANQDSLKITPEHKIAVWDNGVYWKEAKDLKQSDYAITCLDWKLDRTKVSKKEIYKSFVIPKVNVLISQLNTKLKRNDKRCIYRFTKISELKKGRGITRSNLKKILSCLKGIKEVNLSQEFKILTRLVNNYICPVKVKSISELGQDTVYNIQVDDAVNQNYFANFLLVHNCMIDEMDKMTPEDRSAMHEALEQQTVSISKANIQATLRCETTVLAAANPKFGRFDPYGIIAEQINLPPALINRFDLIFAIKDIPEIEKDNKIAGHILKLHQDPDVIEPELNTDFLKKYISYVRQKIKPKLTEGAIEELQKYYVEMRNSGTEDGGIKAVPISPRQLEALVRLSEASAKIRLGTKVSRKDAKKGIELLHFSLSEIGIDPETGKIDIDRITTGISSSQRSHIIIVKEIINTLEKKSDNKPIPVDDIITEAEIKGIAGDIVEDTLEKLKRSGDIYEPRTGFFKKMG